MTIAPPLAISIRSRSGLDRRAHVCTASSARVVETRVSARAKKI